MGSDTSKPAIEGPDDVFGRSDTQFQMISPVSDISNPSDIHKLHRPCHPVADTRRRVSRTVTKPLNQQQRTADGVPAPSAFYFPTNETEKAVERASKKAMDKGKENDRPRFFKKTRKVLKKTQKAMTGCFVDNHQLELAQIEEERHQSSSLTDKKGSLGSQAKDEEPVPLLEPNPDMNSRRLSSESKKSSADHVFVVREADGMVEPSEYSEPIEKAGGSATLGISGNVLHQAEDYFTRLAAEPSRYSEASPYVAPNKSLQNVPSTLGKEEPESPVSNLFEEKDEAAFLESLEVTKSNQAVDATKLSEEPATDFISPTNSMLQYQRAIGQIAETPGFYPEEYDEDSDPVFTDDTNDSSEQENEEPEPSDEDTNSQALVHTPGGLVAIDENTTDEDSAILSYFRPEEQNTNSAFRAVSIDQKEPLKQVATLGPSTNADQTQKVSKLESLFRPVLPTLSADDAQSVSSFDPWEIKVTESAPSVIESADYRALALRRSLGTPESSASVKPEKLGGYSPSMMSVDSQVNASPAMTKTMLSDQARYNAEFLFASEYGKPLLLQRQPSSDRDSALFSISTSGSRSRLSSRSARAKAVKIPMKTSQVSAASDDDHSYSSVHNSDNGRHVRFSLNDAVSGSVGLAMKESIDAPSIESRLSDNISRKSSLGGERLSSTPIVEEDPANSDSEETSQKVEKVGEAVSDADVEPDENGETPATRPQWSYNDRNGVPSYTPHRGNDKNAVSYSPYRRFQHARNAFEQNSSDPIVDVPAIEHKVSDLTDNTVDFVGRASAGSAKSIPASIPEEPETVTPETVSGNSAMQVHWSYSVKDGNLSAVTPHFGKDVKNTTKSPYLRFENAKNKFGKAEGQSKDTSESALPKETKAKKSSPKKEVPFKSPRSMRVKRSLSKKTRAVSVGGVASKIQELNQRVVEAKIDRKKHRWTATNPRRFAIVDSNAIRTRAIVNYRTDVVGLKKINTMSAAKFNTIPVDDDSSVETTQDKNLYHDEEVEHWHSGVDGVKAPVDEDDMSKLTSDDFSKMTTDSSTVATVLQEKPHQFPIYTARVSEGTHSTASSGLSRVKRQVFDGSRQSIASSGESTTLSSIIGKENETYLPFRAGAHTVKPALQPKFNAPDLHLSPTQRTPMQAQKWRTLAAAAAQKDSMKKSNKKTRKGLSMRKSNNIQHPVVAYEC